MPKKDILKKISILVAVSIIGLAVLEIVIAKVLPQKTSLYWETQYLPMFRVGKKNPMEIIPNLHLTHVTDLYHEYDFTVTTDQFGFRRTATSPSKPSVLVLGDSQTFGLGVSNEEAWPNILDNAYHNKCQIVNAGVPGTELNYNLFYLKEILDEHYLTDVKQAVIGLNIPGSGWGRVGRIDPNLDYYRNFIIDNGVLVANKLDPNAFGSPISRWLKYSQTYTFLRETVIPDLKIDLLNRIGKLNKMTSGDYQLLQINEQLIEQMNSLAKEHKIKITFLFLPERPFYFDAPPEYLSKLTGFMDQNNISYFSLLPSMKSAYKKFSDFWLPINGHYNTSGTRFIATQIEKSDTIISECK